MTLRFAALLVAGCLFSMSTAANAGEAPLSDAKELEHADQLFRDANAAFDAKSLWALAHSPAVNRGLHNAHFAERGLVSLEQKWREAQNRIVAPAQLTLALG